jgi:hypothetical protein
LSSPGLVDWQQVVLLLRRRSGLTYERIGRQCTSDHKHIGNLARGTVAEPRFSTGVHLLDMAADHFDSQDWLRVRATSSLPPVQT